MARSLAAAGAVPGDMIQVAYGYGLFTGGLGFHDAAEHMGLTVVPASSGNTLRQILLLQDFRPQGLACTPSFALYIGETMREQGIDPRSVGVRYGMFGAEPWTEAMRAELESLWGDRARLLRTERDHRPGVAGDVSKAARAARERGPLPARDHRSGDQGVPTDGHEGELVLTSLTNGAPMLRYAPATSRASIRRPARAAAPLRIARIKGVVTTCS